MVGPLTWHSMSGCGSGWAAVKSLDEKINPRGSHNVIERPIDWSVGGGWAHISQSASQAKQEDCSMLHVSEDSDSWQYHHIWNNRFQAKNAKCLCNIVSQAGQQWCSWVRVISSSTLKSFKYLCLFWNIWSLIISVGVIFQREQERAGASAKDAEIL